MSSPWKDLLFLHGHLVRKQDLLWSDQTTPEAITAATPVCKAAVKASARPKDCASHWPRLAAPR